jgi:two-component system sensor histidine kinase VicK
MDIMREKLRQDGFVLNVAREGVDTFDYDREAMIQILIDCIDNSIKFGGQSERKEIAISLRQRGDRVEIAISDAGPGIPRHALKNVFDDFYRIDNSLTRKTQGAGIGLSLVKQLAAAMGGGVKASNNTPGPGCAITVDLPLRPRSDAAQDNAS